MKRLQSRGQHLFLSPFAPLTSVPATISPAVIAWLKSFHMLNLVSHSTILGSCMFTCCPPFNKSREVNRRKTENMMSSALIRRMYACWSCKWEKGDQELVRESQREIIKRNKRNKEETGKAEWECSHLRRSWIFSSKCLASSHYSAKGDHLLKDCIRLDSGLPGQEQRLGLRCSCGWGLRSGPWGQEM